MSSIKYFLEVVDGGPDCHGIFELVGTRITLGRHVTADIPLYDRTVNKLHAALHRQDNGYALEDTNSRAGTLVNGVRIEQPVPLKDEDLIKLGNVILIYRCTASA